MTDWSLLSHAYGPADDIPPRLERLATQPTAELWGELWSMLCHQGSTYPASFAALDWLVEQAGRPERDQSLEATMLACAILTEADPLQQYAAQVSALRISVDKLRVTASDATEYAYLLGGLLALDDEAQWHDDLPGGLNDQELRIACPDCETDLFIALGDAGFFSSADDYALADDEVEKRPLEPATELDGLGRRLHEMATTDGQTEVAGLLTYVFGRATCPACEANFLIPEALEG